MPPELVAEAVGATRLVKGRARPDAAGERLVQQPAIEHDVHRAVGRAHLDCAQQRRPTGPRPPPARCPGPASGTGRQGARPGSASKLGRATRRPRRSRRCRAHAFAAARRRDRARRRFAGEPSPRRRAAGRSSAPLRPRNSARSPVQLVLRASRYRRRRHGPKRRCCRDCGPAWPGCLVVRRR